MGSIDPAYLFNRDLNPQESQNVELGIKGNLFRWNKVFFKRFMYEATFFNIRIANEIIPMEVLGDVYYRNAAKTNRLGLEFGAQLEIIQGFNLGLTYTWSRFIYLDYTAVTIEADTSGTLIETDKDFSGNIVPSVPQNNLYFSLTYSRPVSRHASLFAKASYQGISGLWVDDENSDKTNPYNLLNATLGVDLKFGRFNIMASGGVNNIFNEIYVGFTNTNSADKRFYEAGAPRDYFVSLNLGYRF